MPGFRVCRRGWSDARGSIPSGGNQVEVTPEGDAHVKPRVVIVGYGPVGGELARRVERNGFEPFVIDMNSETIDALHAANKHVPFLAMSRGGCELGVDVVYADETEMATPPETLKGSAPAG